MVASGVHDPAQLEGLPAGSGVPPPAWNHPAKLANVYFTYGLARRLPAGVTVNAFDPGLMPGTGLAREYSASGRFMWHLVMPKILPLLRLLITKNIHTPEASGAALARLITDPALAGTNGSYFEGLRAIRTSVASYDEGRATELWEVSLALAAHLTRHCDASIEIQFAGRLGQNRCMQKRNVLAGPYLDRASHLRPDPAWFAAALEDPASRVLALWSTRNLVTVGDPPQAALLKLAQLPEAHHDGAELILLGRSATSNIFAYEYEGAEAPPTPPGMRFEDLRVVAMLLPPEDAGLLSYARAMVHWRRQNRFCGVCGSKTLSVRGGHVLACTNPACRHEVFPRTDPAIIVLISDGERALLGRQASWPAGRYSTIAGFVEPGESLEDAVAREVFEETGVQVDSIEYHSSQPWPFPSSLMLGFTAHAITTEVDLLDKELEDARWFTRAELAAGNPKIPPNLSISFRLIEDWFNAGGGPSLQEVQGVVTWPSSR